MAGCSESGNEHVGPIKLGEFPKQHKDSLLLKKTFAA
jgi:hypothetical protein